MEIRVPWRNATFGIVLFAALAGRASFAQPVSTAEFVSPVNMNSDLYVDFECAHPPQQSTIADFLQNDGFHVIPPEEQTSFAIDVSGYDERRRLFFVFGPLAPNMQIYTMSLMSRPPTHHDTALENRLTDFIQGTLGCKITFQRRGQNPASVQDIFDHDYESLKNQDVAHH